MVHAETRLCEEAGMRPWSPWVHIATNVSHLLLVINGSVNSLIYCSLSSRFRDQVVRLFHRMTRRDPRLTFNARGGGGCNNARNNNNKNNKNKTSRRCNAGSAAVTTVGGGNGNGGNVTVNILRASDASDAEETVADLRRDSDDNDEKGALLKKGSEIAESGDGSKNNSNATSIEMRNGLTQTTQV